MCGICGMAGFAESELIGKMIDSIAHRGPDDAGVYISEDRLIGLGNRRLSILDLSPAGHMPMSNENGTIWVTYNGEIFNFRELRRELQAHGHAFRSRTDTEVLIHAYEQWGVECLDRFNGMFALALWDSANQNLLIARDPFGIKPLYYSTTEQGRLVFASEIKSMISAGAVVPAVDEESLHYYLSFLWVPGPLTLFRNVSKLLPGHYLLWKNGEYSVRRYWQGAPFCSETRKSEPELIEELRDLLTKSVERHLISDVPLGVFLSGGLDSSSILALSTTISNRSMKTYTITYRGDDAMYEQSDEDCKYARLVARIFGSDHNEIEVNPDIVDLLPKIIWHLDEPVADPAAISSYLICRAAREQITVLLSGQGGDEIFGGYRVYLTHRLSTPFASVPNAVRDGILVPGLNVLLKMAESIPGVRPGKVLAYHRYFEKLLRGAAYQPRERFVFHRAYYAPGEQNHLYSPDFGRLVEKFDSYETHLRYFRELNEDPDFTEQMLFVDQKTFLPDLNLTYSDKSSMAASVEVRLPLLDRDLARFMRGIPAENKIKGLKQKYLFKRAMEGMLPHEVIWRGKAAFGAPIRKWLRRDLHGMVDELLSAESLNKRGYFNPDAIHAMVKKDRRGIEDNAFRIWALLTLELWHRTFIDSSNGV